MHYLRKKYNYFCCKCEGISNCCPPCNMSKMWANCCSCCNMSKMWANCCSCCNMSKMWANCCPCCNMSKMKDNCCPFCKMSKMGKCGRTLKKQLSLASIVSIVISTIMFFTSMTWLIYMSDDSVLYNNDPVVAAHLIVFLVLSLMSVYQFTISVLLLQQTLVTEDDVFYYVLWYVSHVSILSLYWAFLILELYVCLKRSRYNTAMIATLVALIYQGIFTYITALVHAALYAVP